MRRVKLSPPWLVWRLIGVLSNAGRGRNDTALQWRPCRPSLSHTIPPPFTQRPLHLPLLVSRPVPTRFIFMYTSLNQPYIINKRSILVRFIFALDFCCFIRCSSLITLLLHRFFSMLADIIFVLRFTMNTDWVVILNWACSCQMRKILLQKATS